MKILITGANGQLGYELKKIAPQHFKVIYTDIDELNITSENEVLSCLAELKPDVVINAAAYTAVDKAESDKATAYAVNAAAVSYLAKACKAINARFIHISTDFIFSGQKEVNRPYKPEDTPQPLSVYGQTKLQGEALLFENMKLSENSYAIVRTSWVYSTHGNNFVKTMLRLMAEKPEMGIVADQIGLPTWAHNLANICWQLVERKDINGVFHYSDSSINTLGSNNESRQVKFENCGISWFDFAKEIQTQAINKGLLNTKIPLNAITTADYPTPAQRPAYSVMDCSLIHKKLNLPFDNWQQSLSKMLDEFKDM